MLLLLCPHRAHVYNEHGASQSFPCIARDSDPWQSFHSAILMSDDDRSHVNSVVEVLQTLSTLSPQPTNLSCIEIMFGPNLGGFRSFFKVFGHVFLDEYKHKVWSFLVMTCLYQRQIILLGF